MEDGVISLQQLHGIKYINMIYEIRNSSTGAPIDNGDGTITFNISYDVGITGEKYLPNKNDGCTVILSKSLTGNDMDTQIQTAVLNDMANKYI